jgi:hypothetical protein
MLATDHSPAGGIMPEITRQPALQSPAAPMGMAEPSPASRSISRVDERRISNPDLASHAAPAHTAAVIPAGARIVKIHGFPAPRLLKKSGRKIPGNTCGPSSRANASATPPAGQIGENTASAFPKSFADPMAVK